MRSDPKGPALIAHLTVVHPRTDVRIHLRECRALAHAFTNSRVTLVVADGFGHEVRDGVNIVDAGRPANRLHRLLSFSTRIFNIATRSPQDIFHIHDPELLVVGYLLRRRGAVVIYDSHEDLPRAVLSKAWIPRALRRPASLIIEYIEDWFVRRISVVVAATPAICARFRRVASEVRLVANYPVEEELVEDAISVHRSSAACYVGGIERIRGALTMIRAVDQADVELELAGAVYPNNFRVQLQHEQGWRRVQYHGVVPRTTAQQIMRRCAVGLLLFLPEPNHVDSQPNKLFEYMAAGLPIIASDFPLWREIIEDAACGVLVDPSDSRAVADALKRLIQNPEESASMGRRGASYVRKRFTWESQRINLINLYRDLLGKSKVIEKDLTND